MSDVAVVYRDGVPYIPDEDFLETCRIEARRWPVLLERLAEQ